MQVIIGTNFLGCSTILNAQKVLFDKTTAIVGRVGQTIPPLHLDYFPITAHHLFIEKSIKSHGEPHENQKLQWLTNENPIFPWITAERIPIWIKRILAPVMSSLE